MADIKIESGIPIPSSNRRKGTGRGAAFEAMNVGDSVLFIKGHQSNIAASFAAFAYRDGGRKKFITRKMDGGVRVWRIE